MKRSKLADFKMDEIGSEIQIAGAVWASKDKKAYLAIFPDESIENLEIVLLPMDTTEWERFLKQTDIKEREIIEQGPQGIVKAIVRKSQRQIDASLQWEVFKRDGYQCRYCGRTGVPLSVDHIDLWEEGGATIRANLLATCKRCNRTRGRTPYEEWLNSEDYKEVSQNLGIEQQKANITILKQLPQLKALRVSHIRSR